MFKKIAIALSALTLSSPAWADKPLRILYMEVDQGEELMSRHSTSFQEIYDQTGRFLQDKNIRLLERKRSHARTKRSFRDAFDFAKTSAQKKLDGIVLISVKHKEKYTGHKIKDQLLASAKIIDGQTLQVLKTIHVKSPTAKISSGKCHDPCRELIFEKHVRTILPEFKTRLGNSLRKLKKGPPPKTVTQASSEYTLTLQGFKAREVHFLEDQIVRLTSTYDLSSLPSSANKPAFWLERSHNADPIRDDLAAILSQLNLQARIIQTSKQITLIKVSDGLAYLN